MIRAATITFTAILAMVSLLAVSPRVAVAHDPEGMYVPLFLVPAHASVVPAYASTIYYAVRTDRPMHPAWAVTNFTTAAGLTAMSTWQFITFVGKADSFPVNVGLSVAGFAGAGLVTTATILQMTRDKPGDAAPVAIVPVVDPDGSVALRLYGRF